MSMIVQSELVATKASCLRLNRENVEVSCLKMRPLVFMAPDSEKTQMCLSGPIKSQKKGKEERSALLYWSGYMYRRIYGLDLTSAYTSGRRSWCEVVFFIVTKNMFFSSSREAGSLAPQPMLEVFTQKNL